jgi:hypothetical protein
MTDDPLVEEARKAGQAYIDSFKGDRKAMLADLRRREKESGHRVVRLPPKSPRRRAVKKAS